MKKLFSIILTALIILSNIYFVNAKSIDKLGSEGQVDNVGISYEIIYNELPSKVYYGVNGIDIVNENGKIHFQTEFPVLKLIIINDVDKDGNSDFLVFEEVAQFNDQLFVVSSKDGSVISSTRFTHLESNEDLGNIESNSYIYDMRYVEDKVMVLYDYKLVNLNPQDCSVIYEYENKDNIWDYEVVNGKIYFIDQLGQFGIVDFETGELIEIQTVANKHFVTLRYNKEHSFNAQMSLFDIYYDGNQLYLLSEDGYLYFYNFESNSFENIPIGLIPEEDFISIISDSYGWANNGPVYDPVGIFKGQFRGYKVIDDSKTHLLISCYFLDDQALTQDVYGPYPSMYALYNKEDKSIVLFGGNVAAIKYSKAVFAKYEVDGEVKDVVTTVFASEEKRLRINVFDYQGNQLLQKDITIDALQSTSKYSLKYDENNGYLLEIFSAGVISMNKNFGSVTYLYDSVFANLELIKDDYIILSYKVNGKINRIEKYQVDMETMIWSYDLDIKEKNHGFEVLKYDDFNMDGVEDVIGIVVSYNDKDEPKYSNYMILNGTDGKVLANRKIFLYDNYDEKGRKYKVYASSKEVELIRDLNGDKKKELLIPEGIVASNSWSVKGSISNYFDTKGYPYAVGDVNKDGFVDYISISDTKVELWTSRIYSTYNVEYRKQKAALSLKKEHMNMTYGTIFGDINNDGIKEFVLINKNNQGNQIFDVHDGKTLKKMYSLCQDGVKDYEVFSLLDIDLNNDGYKEIYHGTYYWGAYIIVDGKTGEDLTWINKNEYNNVEINEDYGMILENIVPFIIEENPDTGLMSIKDINGDGLNDFAVLKFYDDQETWERINALMVYDAKTFELLKESRLNFKDWPERYYDVDNTDRYIFIKGSQTLMLIDLDDFKDIANYKLIAEKFVLINDSMIIASNGENEVYTLDIGESFKITTKFDEHIDEHIIHIEWVTQLPYAVTAIYDNNTLITLTQDKQYDLELTEGKHVITLELNDGQGKSAKSSFEVTVLKQKSNRGYIVGLAAVAIIVGFVLNLYRKTYVKRQSKGGLK